MFLLEMNLMNQGVLITATMFLERNHSPEARRELVQEFPEKNIIQTIKCIIYAGLTDMEAKRLVWDHNKDSECRMSMTFIQRVIFIHNEFE